MKEDIKSKNKREVTHIKIIWEDKQDLIKLSNEPTFANFILEKSYESIKKAISDDLDKVELFDVFNLSLIVELQKSNFPLVLEKIKDMYVVLEDYEECKKIQTLIEKI
jgi:hypothetical protein|tara:strand:- start:1905 stop:2228 length:324 start_codon:yes stop_codon:yes gene_type:complete